MLAIVVVACGDSDDNGASDDRTATSPTNAASATTSRLPTTTTAQEAEVTAGPVTVLANDYGLPDATGWSTAAVFDLTNNGDNIVAVPYRVSVESIDGGTAATSDGSDTVVLGPGEIVTVVLDGLDPTGEAPPTTGTVTVYGRTGPPAPALVGEPEWVSSNETFDCDNGLVGCGLTGDLTYNGDDLGFPERIQVVAYQGVEVVAAGHPTTEVAEVGSGQTIPYAGQVSSAEGFDGTGVSDVRVMVEQIVQGD